MNTETRAWRQDMASAFTCLTDLLEALGLCPEDFDMPIDPHPAFSFLVPRPFVDLMRHGDPKDPLLLQVLPLARERNKVEGFGPDPLGEASCASGAIVQKYRGRALVLSAATCAVNCRYCFRREFPYASHVPSSSGWRALSKRLRAQTDLTEVILSGGDPLVTGDDKLAELVQELESVRTLHTLRIHSRVPIVIPSRLTEQLASLLRGSRFQVVIVFHANHANELGESLEVGLQAYRGENILLLNQSVLLAGVNDTVDDLVALSERLFQIGVMPYYLHQLDRAGGVAHFEVSDAKAKGIYGELLSALPGYLVPRLVREVPDLGCKLPISPTF